jgi:hypothetical protein
VAFNEPKTIRHLPSKTLLLFSISPRSRTKAVYDANATDFPLAADHYEKTGEEKVKLDVLRQQYVQCTIRNRCSLFEAFPTLAEEAHFRPPVPLLTWLPHLFECHSLRQSFPEFS